MARTFIKPTSIKVKLSKYKRRVPSSFVMLFDNIKSGVGLKRINYTSSDTGYTPFFIIGAGRSGNTLLRKQLVENSNICIPPEIPGLGATIRFFIQNRTKPWNKLVPSLLKKFKLLADVDVVNDNGFVYNLNRELNLDYGEINHYLQSLKSSKQSLANIINAIYDNYAKGNDDHSSPIIGDKTPWNTFYLKQILTVYPKAKFVHIVRDSRAVVSSYLKSLSYLNNSDIHDAVDRWLDSVNNSMELGSVLDSNQFYQLKYEDLVKNSEKEITMLLNFLNATQKTHMALELEDKQLSHHQNLNKPVTDKYIMKWKTELTEKEVDFINYKTKRLMSKLNYDL